MEHRPVYLLLRARILRRPNCKGSHCMMSRGFHPYSSSPSPPMSPQAISPPTPQPVRPGLTNFAVTPAATAALRELLHKDYVSHHCFFNDLGFHNHLPHHLVAAYDLGASPPLLELIYKDEAPTLRAIDRQGEDITEGNWTTRLGEHKAYGSYLAFFAEQIAQSGVQETMKRFVMAPEANGNDALMFARLLGGALHPFLQVGFGAEFGQDYMVAQGLAMAAVTSAGTAAYVLDKPSGLPKISTKSTKGVTLLSLLREVYDSQVLTPVLPYDPNALLSTRTKQLMETDDRGAELKRIYAKWSIDTSLTGSALDQEIADKIEECFWQATLLLAATGKPNRAPRPDFFLMHVLTSAICLPSLLSILPDPVHKAQLLQGYARSSALYILIRGRPRIDIPLLMSYTEFPAPPKGTPPGSSSALGAKPGEETNPWLAIIENSLHHKDAHVMKVVRTLYYCAVKYGDRKAGEAIGVKDGEGNETHVGAGKMDGTVFVRAAGVVTDRLGWVAYGGKEGEWDRSALGYDAAWDGDD
ncbi:hypothetical protein R3P38DRAFT_2873562 [Favolaschia claudopus]|uniref:Oxidoreductase AflY n=1 Tax=Favolaschia claudopus TaxID=2862362 RepID=A0AAW0D6E7_9AGAR